MFDLQEDISLAIVNALKVKLLEVEKEKLFKRYTDNVEAHNLYQQGLYFFNQLDLRILDKSIDYFNESIEKDPEFAPAYMGLGGCYFCKAYFGLKKSCDMNPLVKKYIEKTLEIDDHYSGGYHLLALYNACMEWKPFEEAQSAYERSLELNPNDALGLQNYSIHLVSAGKIKHARKLAERAQAIDPLSDYTEMCMAFPGFYSGKYDLVLERISKYAEVDPPFLWGLWFLWRTLSLTKRKAEAAAVCKKLFAARGAQPIAQAMEQAGIEDAIGVAALHMAEVYKQRYVSPYDIAILFSHAGRQEEAIWWVEKSIEDRDPKLHFLGADPEWQSVREDPRFGRWVKTVGFRT